MTTHQLLTHITLTGIDDTIAKLREKAVRAQEMGVKTGKRLGYSKARIEKDKHVWAVTIKSGDLLRVLDALEGKQ